MRQLTEPELQKLRQDSPDLHMLYQTYPDMQKPIVRLLELSTDEEFLREKKAWDEAKREYNARIQAEANKKLSEIALNMLRDGMSKDAVSRYTELPLAEIEALAQE
jgi:hypothetical protein